MIENLADRVRAIDGKIPLSQTGLIGRFQLRYSEFLTKLFSWIGFQARTLVEQICDPKSLFVDRRQPSGLASFRLKFPFEQMLEQGAQPARNFPFVAPPQALDLLSKILAIEVGETTFTQ